MGYLSYDLPSSEVSELSQIADHSLRDWRRRGFLEGVGQEQQSGRWKYSYGDALRLGIVRVLLGYVTKVEHALFFAESVELDVAAQIHDLDQSPFFRFTVFWASLKFETQFVCLKMASLNDFCGGSLAPFSSVVDALSVSIELPEDLRRRVPAPSQSDAATATMLRHRRRYDDTHYVEAGGERKLYRPWCDN